MKTANRVNRTGDSTRLAAIVALATALALGAIPAAAGEHKTREGGKDSGKGRVEAQRGRGTDRGPTVERRAPEPRKETASRGDDRKPSSRDRGRPERSEAPQWNGRADRSPRYQGRPAPVRRYIPYEPHNTWVTHRWHPVRPARPQVWYGGRPYYSHVRLGILFPKFWFDVSIVDAPPPGCAFYDPYCDVTFGSIGAYRAHLCGYDHAAALDIVVVDGGACDPYWEPRVAVGGDCGY